MAKVWTPKRIQVLQNVNDESFGKEELIHTEAEGAANINNVQYSGGMNISVCPTTRASLFKWDRAKVLTIEDVIEALKQNSKDYSDLWGIEMMRVRKIKLNSPWHLIEWTIHPELGPGSLMIIGRALLQAADSYNIGLEEPEFLFDAILGFGGRRICDRATYSWFDSSTKS